MATSGFGGEAALRASQTVKADDASAYVLDRPAVQKTPISALQEMCTRRNMKPEYELLSTEGQVHEPTFMYRVTVGDLSAVGQGKSKKTAKHLAAKAVLERIVQVGRQKEYGMGETEQDAKDFLRALADPTPSTGPSRLSGGSGGEATAAPVSSGVSVTSDDGGEGAGNPVGRLQEYCLQKKWPVPAYEVTSEDGPPHERNFVVEVSLGKFIAEGKGRSKKNAKRDAAENMMKFLDKMPPENQRENLGFGEEDDLAETGGAEAIVQQPFPELDEHFSNLGLSDGQFVIADDEKFGLMKLAEMDLSKEKADEKHLTLLKMIGDDEHWEPEYYPLPRRSTKGDYQCLVQLNAMPVAVCYGRGSTMESAKQAAAFNALEYLKVMTKN